MRLRCTSLRGWSWLQVFSYRWSTATSLDPRFPVDTLPSSVIHQRRRSGVLRNSATVGDLPPPTPADSAGPRKVACDTALRTRNGLRPQGSPRTPLGLDSLDREPCRSASPTVDRELGFLLPCRVRKIPKQLRRSQSA